MNYRIFTVLILLSFTVAVQAAAPRSLASVTEAKSLADKAMKDAVAGHYRKAFDRFRPFWPLSRKEIDTAINKIESGMKTISKRFGKPLGYAYIETKRTQSFLVRFIYVLKYQNALVRWSFTYYKPRRRWHVLGVSFDDNYESLLK